LRIDVGWVIQLVNLLETDLAMNIEIDPVKIERKDNGKSKRRVRPKTANRSSNIPRYLQGIHGSVSKDDSFDVRSFFYRDLAVIRYFKNQRAQVIQENKFIKIFLLRNNDPFWRTVDYIQTNVKSQVGIGTSIVIRFYSDLEPDPKNPDRIQYDLDKFQDDEEIKDEMTYCLKQ